MAAESCPELAGDVPAAPVVLCRAEDGKQQLVRLGAIADYFLPDYGAPRAGDTTSVEEFTTRLGRAVLASGSVQSAVERLAV